MTKIDLKLVTETLIYPAQEKALTTYCIKYGIDNISESDIRRIRGQSEEAVWHIARQFTSLAQK